MKYHNYDRLAEVYDETRLIPLELSSFFKHEIQNYLKNNFFPPPNRILSIGLGTGRVESLLSSRNYQLFGIDIASKMLKMLNNKEINPPCYTAQADGFSLPFSKPFHIILLIQVIHLIDHIEKFFEEVRNFGQVLVVGNAYTETHEHPYYVKFLELLKKNGWSEIKEDVPKSVKFREFMSDHDFSVIEKKMSIESSLQNLQIYEGIKNRYFSSFWQVENNIFNQTMLDFDQFISDDNCKKSDVYQTRSNVNLTFYELN